MGRDGRRMGQHGFGGDQAPGHERRRGRNNLWEHGRRRWQGPFCRARFARAVDRVFCPAAQAASSGWTNGRANSQPLKRGDHAARAVAVRQSISHLVCRNLYWRDRPWPAGPGVGTCPAISKDHRKSGRQCPMKALLPSFLLLCAATLMEAGVERPLSARGADAKTLLIYSDTRAQFSMSEGLEVLRLQLRRVATQIESLSVSN